MAEAQITLSPLQQQRVWENLLAAEIRANYFAELASNYRWHQRVANFATLIFSSGAVAAFLIENPDLRWLRPVLAVITAAISAYTVIAQNHDRATAAMDLHVRWNKLSKQYAELWENMYADTAVTQLRKLEETADELSKNGISFPNNEKDMLKWQQHVVQHHTGQ